MNNHSQEVVLSGTWLYDNAVPTGVHIIRQNYDFWYEVGKANGDLEPDEEPQLNKEGCRYYAIFGRLPEKKPYWVSSIGFGTLEEARRWAEGQLPSEVTWSKQEGV